MKKILVMVLVAITFTLGAAEKSKTVKVPERPRKQQTFTNEFLYMLGKFAAKIYGDATIPEDQKAEKVGALIKPCDAVQISIPKGTQATEKEIYGRKCYIYEATIDYGEATSAPVKAYIYALELDNRVQLNLNVSLKTVVYTATFDKSRVSPKLTVKLFEQDFANFVAANAKGI